MLFVNRPFCKKIFFPFAYVVLSVFTSCSTADKLKQSAELHTVKFRTIGRIPVIEASLNGKRAIFIVDTGASVSVINESEMNYFKFKIRSASSEYAGTEVVGFGGKENLNIVFDCSIEIGSRAINSIVFKSSNMSHLGAIICKTEVLRFAGILGSDILHRYQMNIDFRNGTITCQ